MKLDNFKGYNDDMKYKEGVLTLLEELIKEVYSLRQLITPEDNKPPVEPVKEVKKKVTPKKKKEVV